MQMSLHIDAVSTARIRADAPTYSSFKMNHYFPFRRWTCGLFGFLLTLTMLAFPALAQEVKYHPDALPKGREYFQLRGGLRNSGAKFVTEKKGRVAFLGGSITAAFPGWRESVMKWVQSRFPETEFDFIGAGIGSLGSVPHAFRFERDVLYRGSVDLLFVEAAVNDATNIPEQPVRMLRGMEGVVRHARNLNPYIDIVQMHFAMPEHLDGYRKGQRPEVISIHEKVADAYGNASLDLAMEVTDRIDAGEFTWEGDFKNLHPSPFGNQLYANSIARMLKAAWERPVGPLEKHALPARPLDPQSYTDGHFGSIESVRLVKGFKYIEDWAPVLKAGTRAGFVHVPALVATEPGAELEISFEGRGVGLMIGAGPDTGIIEVSCDGGRFTAIDTFTRWSSSLYLPWALILEDELSPGHHVVRVRLSTERNEKSRGTGLYVFQILEN